MGSIRRAILVMVKAPRAGAVKTRLCPPFTPEQAAALAEALLRDTVQNALAADCGEVVLVTWPPESEAWFAAEFPDLARIPQRGHDLGERLRHAFEDAWRLRYQPCVCIGTDSPDLPPERIRLAFDALRPGPESVDVVLGPSEDGGYYLIGLAWKQPSLFANIEWSTERVLTQTLQRAEEHNLTVKLLPSWYDIDTVDDLQRLLRHLNELPPQSCPAVRHYISVHEDTRTRSSFVAALQTDSPNPAATQGEQTY